MLAELPRSPFPILSLTRLSNVLSVDPQLITSTADKSGNFYKLFDIISSSSEKVRHIDNPLGDLRFLQKRINKNILRKAVVALPEGMIGGVAGKSLLDNAGFHIGKQKVARIDLRDCFPNTHDLRIYDVWRNTLGSGKKIAGVLTQLTTFQHRLPQGTATSLMLCNLSLLPLFSDIDRLATKKGLSFTLWVDDIIISGSSESVNSSISPIIRFIQTRGYAIKHEKIEIKSAGRRQDIPGGFVNKKFSISRSKELEVRNTILGLAKKGVYSRQQLGSIEGKIAYIKRISPEKADRIQGLVETLLTDPVSTPIPIEKNEIYQDCSSTEKHEYYHKDKVAATLGSKYVRRS